MTFSAVTLEYWVLTMLRYLPLLSSRSAFTATPISMPASSARARSEFLPMTAECSDAPGFAGGARAANAVVGMATVAGAGTPAIGGREPRMNAPLRFGEGGALGATHPTPVAKCCRCQETAAGRSR